jgi:hypothetical protein
VKYLCLAYEEEGKLNALSSPKETLGGFFLIEATDLDDALAVAARWPSARIGSIEVRPIEEALSEERRYR